MESSVFSRAAGGACALVWVALEGSVDVRLGEEFIITDRTAVAKVDPLNQTNQQVRAYLRNVHVPFGGCFVLHPRQFTLGATLEYVRMPGDLAAHVVGRSRWARVGLVIAMATFVHPWYAGCLTLELQNLGDAPIQLRPGMSVAQLIFEQCEPVDFCKKEQLVCAIGPEQPLLIDGQEQKLLEKLQPSK